MNVPVSSVGLLRNVSVLRRVSELRCVGKRTALVAFESVSVESESVPRQSPRMILTPAFEALKRAAEAKKCQRIARRLAGFAGGRVRQSSWSSAKSAPGVH